MCPSLRRHDPDQVQRVFLSPFGHPSERAANLGLGRHGVNAGGLQQRYYGMGRRMKITVQTGRSAAIAPQVSRQFHLGAAWETVREDLRSPPIQRSNRKFVCNGREHRPQGNGTAHVQSVLTNNHLRGDAPC